MVSAFKMECCPPSPWNGVRDDGGTLPAISMESCPPSRGIRNYTSKLINKYLEQRTSILEKFPGKHDSRLLILTKRWHLEPKIANLTNRKLRDIRITALVNILQTGFRDRRALEASLGVSQQTIINIERLCGWDFQQTVSDEAAALRRDLIDGKLADR